MDVTDRNPQGSAIAERVAAAIGERDGLTVEWRERDPDPTADGTLAFAVERPREGVDGDGNGDDPLAEAYVQPNRIRLEFAAVPDVAAEVATDAGLRVRPKAVRPPRTLAFVEDADEASSAADVVAAVAESLADEDR